MHSSRLDEIRHLGKINWLSTVITEWECSTDWGFNSQLESSIPGATDNLASETETHHIVGSLCGCHSMSKHNMEFGHLPCNSAVAVGQSSILSRSFAAARSSFPSFSSLSRQNKVERREDNSQCVVGLRLTSTG